MATNILTFRAVGIRASATSDHRKPNRDGWRSFSASGWWAPLFGWSSEVDYIDSSSSSSCSVTNVTAEKAAASAAGSVVSSRFVPGCFTAEKAKQLRRMTVGTAAFHDVMYHSAIASRLASDFGNPSGGD